MNHKILLFFSILLILSTTNSLFGQDRITVQGTVKEANGDPIVGASIVIKGTTIGVSADLDGKFQLSNVSANATLEVSMISYVTKEIPVNNRTSLEVILASDVETLGEAVVIGYGTVRKSDVTGSVVAIKAESMNRGLITSPQELMQGRIAGVNVLSHGGTPGGAATIRIRGGSSLNASNDPLIVLDGVPLNDGGLKGVANPLSMINPEDIETFTVLKDASATAIYGSRASNGVIMITTKKGRLGSKMQIGYNGNMSVSMRKNEIEVLTGDEYRDLVKNVLGESSDAANKLGTANTDWQKEVFRVALGTEHNISASGGVLNTPYRVSLGYSNQQGILKTSKFERYSAAANINPTFFDDHLKVSLNARISHLRNRFADNGAIGAAIAFDPTQNVRDDRFSQFGGYFTWATTDDEGKTAPIGIATKNPMALLNMKDKTSKAYNFIGNAMIDYKFHFLPELKAVLNLAYDYADGKENEYIGKDAPMNYLEGGRISDWTEKKKNELLEFYFNYEKEVKPIASRFNLMAGYSWQHFHKKKTEFERNVDGDNVFKDRNPATEYYLLSFYGRFNYSLLDRYMFTFTLRDDASSRFSPDERWGLFPSMALGWKINEEAFLREAKAISDLRLRLGWGITGQQNITNDDDNYIYMSRYTYSTLGAYYQIGDKFFPLSRPSAYNKYLKWEETTTYNAGLDFAFFKNRVNGSFDVYFRETKDLISEVNIPAGTNFKNRVLTNFGTLENKGFEFSLNVKPIITKNFTWDVGYNMSMNRSELTKLSMSDNKDYTVQVEGVSGTGNYIQAHRIGNATNSFFVYEQVYDLDGKPLEGVYRDRNGDGIINMEDRYLFHRPTPDVSFGLTNKFLYKNWDLGFVARASVGNYVYNRVAADNAGLSGNSIYNSAGYLSNRPRSAFDTNFGMRQVLSDYYVQNASFIRIDNITLGYSFSNLVKKSAMGGRVFATVQNPVVITKYKGLDPEVDKGIDNDVYPRPLMIIVGLSLNF